MLAVCAWLFALLLFCVNVPVDGQWCATSTMSLPAPQSNSVQWFGSGDNECSAFFFSANPIANTTAEAIIGVTSETLQLVNKSAPIPAELRAAGYRYINDIDVWPELLFAPMSKELPSSSSSLPTANTTGAIVVFNLGSLKEYNHVEFATTSPLAWTTYDYSSQILYAGGAGTLDRVYTFAVDDSTFKLTRTADIILASPPTNFVSAVSYVPNQLMIVQSVLNGQKKSANTTVSLLTLSSGELDIQFTVATAGLVTAISNLWDSSDPKFGLVHFNDANFLYNWDNC